MIRRDKGQALLHFLKEAATLRRRRIAAYGAGDRILWFSDIPRDREECYSPLISPERANDDETWLVVRKPREPVRPSLPETISDWVRLEDLTSPETEPEILEQITVLVEKTVPDPDAPTDEPRTIIQTVPEIRRLQDYPDVQAAWLHYLTDAWRPWAEAMRRWQEVYRVYAKVDEMRRRLAEAEERYELFLGLGLLQWRDGRGVIVKRHLLAGPAEIELDAARGILTVVPAADFESFKLELDMLESEDQPPMLAQQIHGRLEELDTQAWEREQVATILGEIANRAWTGSQVDADALNPAGPADETFRVFYAPALVLRERRVTVFEEVVEKLLDEEQETAETARSRLWEQFLAEGDESLLSPEIGLDSEHSPLGSTDLPERIYFPLPANEEQGQIIRRLRHSAAVVVKGPPGTGKSHTIANLICHLLACGERILVTAEAPKALSVLRDKLPEELQALCVTSFSSSREDQRLLEEGIRRILSRDNTREERRRTVQRIEGLERELTHLGDELAKAERHLREVREAETHVHTLPGGYQGTAAQIAQRLEAGREEDGWFPEPLRGYAEFPLQPREVSFLADVHAELTPAMLRELRCTTGNGEMLRPEEFGQAVTALRSAEEVAAIARQAADADLLSRLRIIAPEAVQMALAFIRSLDEVAIAANRVLGGVEREVLTDLLVGRQDRWWQLRQRASELLNRLSEYHKQFGTARVTLSSDTDRDRAIRDAKRLAEHLKAGGWRGFWGLRPKVIKETRYLEKVSTVDGDPPRDPEQLEKLVGHLEVQRLSAEFEALWQGAIEITACTPDHGVARATEVYQTLERLLSLVESLNADHLAFFRPTDRHALVDQTERSRWLRTMEARVSEWHAEQAQQALDACLGEIHQVLATGNAHHCLTLLAQALEARDPVAWRSAWEERERVRQRQARWAAYEQILDRLTGHAPTLVDLIRAHQGDATWRPRILALERAWHWAGARGWLDDVLSGDRYEELVGTTHRLREKIEQKIETIAGLRAWMKFFEGLDNRTRANLTAWADAMERVGQGTGRYAYRHRRAARRYLMACLPKIPAWIMPLHKLYETVDPKPSLFDTVIIDEASQAGLDSLILLHLAKRIIVVGDDKQNSPEAVGVREDDIARVGREHLREFHFSSEFRPDTSLFDHALRVFGAPISLREHFRCVPEIIRFSNDLCYTDNRLIPLRQAPIHRLPPLRRIFVPEGTCEGDRQNILNRAEAEAIVKTILQVLEDRAYEGNSMGVIVLQGHAQAELIDRMLAEQVDPKVLEERRLRCGVPATFQGDERDVIFLSLVVAPNHHYRALTRAADIRRFNVAMSRARDQVWLFHSVQQEDLSPNCLRRKLLAFFQDPWQLTANRLEEERERLESHVRRSPRRRGEQPDPYDSWFEVDVALELLRRNYQIHPQYEVAEYRIDIVVEGLESRLAIECDGDAWHGPERYEHDMARQRQLERAGWTFVRVRESLFYAERGQAIRQIIQACDELGIRPFESWVRSHTQVPRD